MKFDPDQEARRVSLGELTVRMYDRGREPAYRKDRRLLFGAWQRYEAQLVGLPAVRARGCSAFDALHRLVAKHRFVFDERWPALPPDDQSDDGCDAAD